MAYTTMTRRITLEPVDDVPPDSRVCHYDELGDPAKASVPALAGEERTVVDPAVLDGFRGCDLVKYTDYYEISVH